MMTKGTIMTHDKNCLDFNRFGDGFDCQCEAALAQGEGAPAPVAPKRETGDERKLDFGKTPLHLVPWEALDLVITPGQTKYQARALYNWCRRAPGYLDDLQNAVDGHTIAAAGPILEFGAKKYAPYGWEKGIEFTRIADAGLRHALRLPNFSADDPDTGQPHDSHLACNLIFALTYETRGTYGAFDDRPEPAEIPGSK